MAGVKGRSGRKPLRQEVNKLKIISKAWNITDKVLDTLDAKERTHIAKELVLKDMSTMQPQVDARQINIHLGSGDITQLRNVVKQLQELSSMISPEMPQGSTIDVKPVPDMAEKEIIKPCESQGDLKGITEMDGIHIINTHSNYTIDIETISNIESGSDGLEKRECGEGGGVGSSINETPTFPPEPNIVNSSPNPQPVLNIVNSPDTPAIETIIVNNAETT